MPREREARLRRGRQRAKLQLHDHPIRGARHDGHGLRDLGGYNYFNYKDEEGPKAKAGLAGMVGGGIMAAIGGGAVLMLSMS